MPNTKDLDPTEEAIAVASQIKFSRLKVLGAAVGGVLMGVACGPNGPTATNNPAPVIAQTSTSDAAILNFALNLEYLEAEFYNMAVNGQSISQLGVATSGTGTAGPTTGGAQVTISDPTMRGIAQQIANDELNHVKFLRNALGGLAIAKPAINLNGLGTGFGSVMQFLVLARAFEDTGVTAYNGAAPMITSKTLLSAAASILAVEAFHTGSIRTMMSQLGVAATPLDSIDSVPPPSGTQYFDVDANSLAKTRTPAQVIALVTPFFPNGINGSITS